MGAFNSSAESQLLEEVTPRNFEKADVDRDGKISGTEAIQFFKGSNLPQPVLAKIWHAADNGHTGFLSRPEFYNALKLVTVAQSGRDLTPEIMRAALVGPASLKIPAPKIQLADSQQQQTPRGSFSSQVPAGPTQTVATQQPPRTSFSSPQPGSIPQTPRGAFTSTQTATPQQTPRGSFSNSQPQYQAAAAAVAQASAQGVPRPGQRTSTPGYGLEQELHRTSSAGFGGDAWPPATQTTAGVQGQLFSSGPARAISSAVQNQGFSSGAPVQPSSSVGASSQGLQDAFASSAFQPMPDAFPGGSFKVNSTSRALSSTGIEAPAVNAAPAGGSKLSGFDSPFGNDTFSAASTNPRPASAQAKPGFQSALAPTSPATGTHLQTPQPTSQGPAVQNIVGPGQGIRPPAASMGGAWPEMTTSDVQRYSRVFLEVDTDRDAKITGAQARDLFLSWRLPREVLKQVWDLSDQDGDSMLSFREFCTALYLMERFREGRPLPPVLPAGFHFDDGSPQSIAANRIAEAQAAVAQHSAGYNLPSWQRNPRVLQSGGSGMMAIPPGVEPVGMQGAFQAQNMTNRNAGSRHKAYQTNADGEGDKAVGTENKVLDSKEKLEFYRSKLQEIVLFKRKCDNRLAEITDRAAAEKREEELMAKKYEEKYKQALEVNSRLVSEEAAFREIQTRKLELRNAISEIERGGNPNALLQTRADRIANDLDELEKALAQRGQLLGFHVNGTTPVELPFGWQPSLQENAVDWDEEWDKFDDEGYTTIQDNMHEPKTSAVPGWDDGSLFADELDFSSEAAKVQEHVDEAPSAIESPRTESEASSLKSGVDSPLHDLWSPKSQPLKRSMLGSSPLSAKADQSSADDVHEEDSFNEHPSYVSTASFDHGPSFDAGDHPDEKPWSSVFTDMNAHDDIGASWGSSSTSQPLAVKTRPGIDSLDFGSSPASVNGEVKDERDFFGSKDWNDRSGDLLGSTSVPSTPLFKSDSPAKRGSFFGAEDSRLNSFASSQGRVSGVDDDSDPFADTGPFGAKSSDRWSAF